MTDIELPRLRLRAKADKRLRGGHHWIYSNEVDSAHSPLSDYQSGQQVIIENERGKSLGLAMINPHTLICGRLLTQRDSKHALGANFIKQRIEHALRLRERCFQEPYYRLVYGDSDGLSGLVIDRFADMCVVQISSAGMELLREEIVSALQQVLKPRAILLKNDGAMREVEGLPSYIEDAVGVMPDLVPLRENGLPFLAPVRQGQKTGWFYDHRVSRAELQKYVAGKRVLDLFSYVGAWGLQALGAGASSLSCVDSSSQALAWARQNSELNGFADQVDYLQGNAFDVVQALLDAGERYDVVVVDPPAFIKRRKDLRKGFSAYRRINELAIRILTEDGLLVSASCSMHLSREMLVDAVRSAGRHVDRSVQIIAQGHQGPDHPIHPAITETEYLKALFSRISYSD